MYDDGYFPDFLVDKLKLILLDVCHHIETTKPDTDEALCVITHSAVEKINALEEVFEENGSQLETGAREVLGEDFEFVVRTYGFSSIDIEDVIAPREW
jgi:hypothetical protein